MTPGFEALVSAVVLTGGAGAGAYHAAYGVRTQWLGRSDWRGRSDLAAVALTFDDGPSDETERVLDLLGERGVRGAFFAVGERVGRRPAIARRIVDEGHEIGNHSLTHPIYLYTTPRETRRQLARTQDIIADATGIRPTLSRPPCGVRTPAYFRAARELGLRTVQWTVAGFDWKTRSSTKIADAVLEGCAPGAIALLHDGDSAGRTDRRPTVDALPLILEGLGRKGLGVESLQRLLEPDVRGAFAREAADA